MDEVTKTALDIAVEQLEAAEKIIEALTEENERLKRLTKIDPNSWVSTNYPPTTITWGTQVHTSLQSATASAANATVKLETDAKQFRERIESLRKLMSDGAA